MRQIVKLLPKDERQTMLFSATQTTKVEDLARISLRPGPLYVNVDHRKEYSTVEGLEQGYVVCESDLRFRLLFTFLKRHQKKKVIVFMSSCNAVEYYAYLLKYIDIPVLDLHGKQKQQKVCLARADVQTTNLMTCSAQTPSSNSQIARRALFCVPTLQQGD